MTPDQIAELKRIAEAASPGPWRGDRIDGSVKYDLLDADGDPVIRGDNGNVADTGCYGIQSDEDEAYLLAFDPPTCLALIARIEALEAGLKPFSEAAGHLHPAHPENGLTLDGIEVRHWRRAANLLDAARAEGPAPPGGGGEEGLDRSALALRRDPPSPSDGPVLRDGGAA